MTWRRNWRIFDGWRRRFGIGLGFLYDPSLRNGCHRDGFDYVTLLAGRG